MADVIFAIVAVLLTLGGAIFTVVMYLASAFANATNPAEARKMFKWTIVPILVTAVGIYFCFEAF